MSRPHGNGNDAKPEEVRTALNGLIVSTVVLWAVVVIVGVALFLQASGQRERLAAEVERTNSALCALRLDLEIRVENGQAFLEENPEGIPGLPTAAIRQSLEGYRRTVRALSSLECPPRID